MDKPLISVIVPIYKVEKYLEACVESLVYQSYEKLQIILVDDGSPDDCPRMCDQWKEKDSRIEVIHKANGGLGDARNAGLKSAIGEWISFIDSDDYIGLNTYEDCIKKIIKTGADICYFGCAHISDDGKKRSDGVIFPESICGKENLGRELLPKCFGKLRSDPYDIGAAWMGIYKKELFEKNDIWFVSEKEYLSEDYIFTADICHKAQCVTFLNGDYYFYRENVKSLSNSYRKDRFEKIEKFYWNRIEYIKRKELGEESAYRAAIRFWDTTFGCLFQEIGNRQLDKKKKYRRLQEVCDSHIGRILLNGKIIRQFRYSKRVLFFAIKYKQCTLLYILMKIACLIRKYEKVS